MPATLPARVSCLLFDLDGTLVDSAPGITRCLAETIQHFGGPAVRPAALVEFVGPPVTATLRAFTRIPAGRLPDVVAHYRARYLAEGIAQSAPFPEVPALLDTLRARELPLAVATSKRESHARAMLERHRLDSRFAVISGAAEDDTSAGKDAVIRSAIARLAALGADVSAPALVGDRSFDVQGAAAVGVPAVFAAWGYGAPEESAGAAVIAHHPSEVADLLPQSVAGSPVRKAGQHA